MKHLYELVVPLKDKDMIGHINHSNYLKYFEAARWDLYEKNGLSKDDVIKEGCAPIVLDINISYRKEIFAGENVVIESTTGESSGYFNTINHIMRKPDGHVACRATVRLALFDMEKRKIALPRGFWKSLHEQIFKESPAQ